MSTIYLNGVNFGDSSKYKDLISKPTINTHIVEESNTSSDLDIFKYITKEDLEDLNHLNPYCIYAVRDEDDNPDGFYFSNGYQTYVYNNYRVVKDLIEDTTTLQYLIEDTNLYSRGLWGYIEVSPGTFKFMQITNSYDDLTISVETKLFQQKNGYIYGVNTFETNIINQVTPTTVDQTDDTTILSLTMENHIYAPNTKYKLVVNYVGVSFSYEMTPNGATGNDTLEFGKPMKVKLPKDSYPSSNPNDYLITLSWFKPLDISFINPLYLNINESFEVKDGKIGINLSELDYSSISKVTDYLYSIHYDFLDKLYAENNFIENAPPLVGCTSFRKNNIFCRNFDTLYNDKAEFVVETDKAAGRYATLGIAYSNINKEIVETGEYSKEYKAIPFNLVDGINEKGLTASIHTLLLDTASTSQTTTPEVYVKETKNAFLLIRYILDNFAAAKEAAEYIRDYIAVYTPNSYFNKKATTQILISDSSSTYVLEFVNGKNILSDISTKPYITNFSIKNVVYNSDGSVYTPADVPSHTPTIENNIPKYSRGLERYNILNTGYPNISNIATAREMLDNLKYDLCYTDELASDFTRVEDSLTIDTTKDTIMTNSKVLEMIANYNSRTREAVNTYFTSHSAIYNSFDLSLRIVAQEDTEEYLFGLPYKVPSGGYPLGEISNVILDTRENVRLQNIIDKGIIDNEIFYVEYDFQEKLTLNKETSTDSIGDYVSLSGVLTNSGYTYIKIYIDNEYKVLGAKRFKVKLADIKEADIGKDKFLLWNTLLSCKESGYITFSNAKLFKLSTLIGWKGDGTVEWSNDKINWHAWDGITEITSAASTTSGKHEIQIRGISNTTLSDGTSSTTFVITDQNNNTTVKGDLLTLLDCTDLSKNPADYAFKELFKNSTCLISALDLTIPSTHSKYQNLSMFEGCTNLIDIPNFDSTTVLAEGSCQQMFRDCTSIVSPKFPLSDTIAKCFKYMFEGCTSILQTDPLPSDNVAEEAYMGMFKDCASIYTPTLISATSIETRGMAEMFKNCTGLLTPSTLVVLTFGDEACKSMFEGCNNIVWGVSGTPYRLPITGTATAGTDSFKNMMVNNSGKLPETIGTPLPNKEYFIINPDFEFISPNAFKVSGVGWPSNANIKYSYNETKWYNWDKSSEIEATLDTTLNKYRILFRSASNANSSLDGARFVVSSDNKNVEVKGELGNLVTNPTPGNNTFRGLFSDNDTINISENLVLPEIDTNGAFESLFENCTTLTNIPTKLPSALGESACFKMFKNCIKIKKSPIFNGTTLAIGCYKSMFEGCTALEFSYPLTATEIKQSCYESMFKDCSTLKTSPIISGVNIEGKCYSSMFKNCIALQSVPSLPVTTLADYCYSEMFSGCVSITNAPILPAIEMKPWCYSHMFDGCIRLQVVPALPATTLAKYCYTYMFNGCSGFFNAPVLPAIELYEESYSGMFAGCIRMITLPDLSIITTMGKASAANMFNGCSAIPATEIIKLPTAELTEECYLGMFKGCKNIETPPTLPKTTLQPNCYKEMFSGCKKLKSVPRLPATTLATGCYWSMFEGCTAIVYPCKLPALNMVDNCYNSMFKDCKSIPWKTSGKIYRVPVNGTGVGTGTDWNKDMFLNNEGENIPYPLVINKEYHLDIEFDTYFTLSSPNDMTIKHTFDRGIYYSYDKVIWNEVMKNTPFTIIDNPSNVPAGTKVYIAGEINEENYGGVFNITGTNITIAGELIGLVEKEIQPNFITNNIIKFNSLFKNCSILDASDLVIPEFSSGNTGIFKELFKGSTIKNPCQFPTTISENCYEGAFENCTQLRYTPEFNATTLAKECYLNMFKGCTSLVQTSQELRATVLAESCYKSMFEGCTSIEYPSIIHATTMAPTSCADMFKGCTNITWGASGVEYRIPFDKSQSGSPSTNWSANMFDGTSGVSIPTTPDINVVYHTIPNFDKWITLEAPSMYHIDNTTNALNNNLLFYSTDNGTTWTTLPATLDTSDKIYIAGIYANGNLVITGGDNKVALGGELIGLYNNIVEDKFDKTDYGFKGLFKNSVGLSDASGLILPKIGENNKEAYAELFYGCTNLLYAPNFSKVVKLSESACERAFMNCESLITSPELPALELAPKCYKEMFKGCITISMPTQLPAIIMADSCYQGMYEDCIEIKWSTSGTPYVIPKDDTTGISATDWNKDMFKNNSGIYPDPPLLNTTYHTTDYIAIYSEDPSELISLKTENTTLKFSYSTDTINWNILSPGIVVTGNKLYVMGITSGGFSPTVVPHFSITSSLSESNGTSGIIIKGNLKTLCREATTYYFSGLFKNSDIYDARNLRLPSEFLGEGCYKELFIENNYLKYAPNSLKVKEVIGAFEGMFCDCTALTNPPYITFEGSYIRKYCARYMFRNCSSLVIPPKIIYPINFRVEYEIYKSMFEGCTSLIMAPTLPATILAYSCYQSMFSGCSSLTAPPELPATTLATACYSGMFNGCSSLTTAPTLPATTLDASCYNSMFAGCTSLTTAPALPATTLDTACYESMFRGCSSLTTAPELPATTLAGYCYEYMFFGCTSLTTAPELPAENLDSNCYTSMFDGCTSLTTAPELPATTLASAIDCYSSMFHGCTSLTTAPELPATELATSCYYNMFSHCTSLTTPPSILPATVAKRNCYFNMFYNCIKLEINPEIKLTDLTDGDSCCAQMFGNCISLTEPAKLSATYLADTCYGGMYLECRGIEWKAMGKEYSVPYPTSASAIEGDNSLGSMFLGTVSYDGTPVPATPTLNQIYYLRDNLRTQFTFEGIDCSIKNEGSYSIKYSMNDEPYWYDLLVGETSFSADKITIDGEWDCSSSDLDNIDGDRIAIVTGTNVKVSGILPASRDAAGLFRSNYNLIDASGIIFPSSIAGNYSGMFKECTGLIAAPKLPSTTLTPKCYKYMFKDCANLIDAPALPATILKEECYMGMFENCINLLMPCALESTSLDIGCYNRMFKDCNKLLVLPTLPAIELPSSCYERMFCGCQRIIWGEGIPYRIPRMGLTSTTETNWNKEMFAECSGDLPEGTGEPREEQVYYYGTVSTLKFVCNTTTTESSTIRNNSGKNFKYSFNESEWIDFPTGGLITLSPGVGRSIVYIKGVFYGEINSSSVGNFAIDGPNSVAVSGILYPRMNYSGLFTGKLHDASGLNFPIIGGRYVNMFKNTILTQPTTLPSQNLLPECYKSMFEGTSISECPELPAINLTDSCYESMFANCVNIENCPTFSAVNLKPRCYANMFEGCVGLKSPAILPSLEMAEHCYLGMFRNCSQFLWKNEGTAYRLPSAGTGITSMDWAKEMFIGNSGVLPGIVLGTPEINTEYYFSLLGKTELKFKAINGGATITNHTGVILAYSTDEQATWNALHEGWNIDFDRGTSVYLKGYFASTKENPKYIGVRNNARGGSYNIVLSGNLASGVDYYQLFMGQNIDNAYGLIFPEESGDYSRMFKNSSLSTPPNSLPSKKVGKECYSEMFMGCQSLTRIPRIEPGAELGESACDFMFAFCTGMEYIYETSNGSIGPFTLSDSCCSGMFWGCTLLREIPILPTKTMAPGCYNNMFRGCTFIWGDDGIDYRIPSVGTGTAATQCTTQMFLGNEGDWEEKFSPSGSPLINTTYKYKYAPITRLTFKIVEGGISGDWSITNNTYRNLRYKFGRYSPYIHVLRVGESMSAREWGEHEYITVYGIFDTDLNHSLIIDGEEAIEVSGELVPEYNYDYLFYTTEHDNYGITKADGLIFPTECGSYKGMFRNNKNLYDLPNLPAINLKDNCYYEMFRDCSRISFANITTPRNYRVPSGTGTGISGVDSLKNMFLGCSGHIPTSGTPLINTTYYLKEDPYIRLTSISSSNVSDFTLTNHLSSDIKYSTSIHGLKSTLGKGDSITINDIYLWDCESESISDFNKLEITGADVSVSGTLKDSCKYRGLFHDCSTIKDASGLIMSDELTDYCYQCMFWNCTSLTKPPQFPATTLAEGCYQYMFRGCTSLTTPPELPATQLAPWCYYQMFRGCTSLTTAPELPALTVPSGAYIQMFDGCTSLTTPPATLPATTLTGNCYERMFQNCTSLTTPPTLPATTLTGNCYERMFQNCTSLTTAPVLPATQLAVACYQSMFSGCTSLTTPPILPATTLAEACYGGMFYDCTSLTTTPTLPAAQLAESCYESMFAACSSLTTPPQLPATTLAKACYNSMFYGCASLTILPELPATSLADNCYSNMFKGCASINFASTGTPYRIPSGTTAGTSGLDSMHEMFKGCYGDIPEETGTPLINTTYYYNYIPATETLLKFTGRPVEVENTLGIPLRYSVDDGATWTILDGGDSTPFLGKVWIKGYINNQSNQPALGIGGLYVSVSGQLEDGVKYIGLFLGQTRLVDASGLKGSTTLTSGCYSYMFFNCTSLTKPPQLPATTLADECYSWMFKGCTSLTTPPTLPATTLADRCYWSMFWHCAGLEAAPELPATTLADGCYYEMFRGCTSLTTPPQLPATTLAGGCYTDMFEGCTSLTTPPQLPATTLAGGCYMNMFWNCTSLTTPPTLPATTLAGGCYQSMFWNCTSLTILPELPATSLADNCYSSMFRGCASINFASTGTPYRIPSGTATGTSGYASMDNMFEGCSGDIPEGGYGTPLINKTYYYTNI